MISVAEESNTLETVLLQVADSLERRTWRQLDLAVRLLEPIMLLMLAGVVLVLVIAPVAARDQDEYDHSDSRKLPTRKWRQWNMTRITPQRRAASR